MINHDATLSNLWECVELMSARSHSSARVAGLRASLGEMRNLRPLATRLAADRRAWKLRLARLHDEVVPQRVPRAFHVTRRRLLVVVQHVVADEMTRDAELHIAVDELVVRDIDLRDQGLEAIL